MPFTALSRLPLDPTRSLPPALARWYTALVLAVNGTISGEGSPEGVVTAPQGTLFRRTDGGALTSLYVKESGGITPPLTNTGWAAK